MRSKTDDPRRAECATPAASGGMERREFLAASLLGAAGALGIAGASACGHGETRTTCNRQVGDAHAGSVLSLAVDSSGNVALPFNSEGMYRAWMTSDGTPNASAESIEAG